MRAPPPTATSAGVSTPTGASPGSGPTSPTSSGARSTEAGLIAPPVEEPPPPPQRRRLLHGRRHGPKLRPGRRRLLDTSLPALAVAVEPGQRIDPFALFSS